MCFYYWSIQAPIGSGENDFFWKYTEKGLKKEKKVENG